MPKSVECDGHCGAEENWRKPRAFVWDAREELVYCATVVGRHLFGRSAGKELKSGAMPR